MIVEDEPLARRRLARMVAAVEGFTLVGEAEDVETALAGVQALRPDILLLDIQMPGATGFDLIDRLGSAVPVVIFVTAFDHHALNAFDAGAIDYVTKPVSAGRLAAALGRAATAAQARRDGPRLFELSETVATLRSALRDQSHMLPDFWVKAQHEHVRVRAAQIIWFEAERDYVRIHTEEGSYLHHESLASLERRLGAAEFVRVHRSAIVRLDRITSIRRAALRGVAVMLDNGTEVRVGKTFAGGIRQMLGDRR